MRLKIKCARTISTKDIFQTVKCSVVNVKRMRFSIDKYFVLIDTQPNTYTNTCKLRMLFDHRTNLWQMSLMAKRSRRKKIKKSNTHESKFIERSIIKMTTVFFVSSSLVVLLLLTFDEALMKFYDKSQLNK